MDINRALEQNLERAFFKKKVILLFGARQVGKTTLLNKIFHKIKKKELWLNGDDLAVQEMFEPKLSSLKKIVGDNEIIIIDEAQRIKDIGLILKLLIDSMPNKQYIASGSSAFELNSETSESLTGRKFEYLMYPLSFQEMVNHTSYILEKATLEHRLIYGYYPDVINHEGQEVETLKALTNSYLYKDVLSYDKLKKPQLIIKLLQALALQIGNEVSYTEIGQLIGADKETVERYIDLLEKTFIIFRLHSLSRNMRNEIKKGKKIYFYDNGVRNAIINSFSPLSLRNDTGALWENFVISERIKYLAHNKIYVNMFFWRTTEQQEIDYIEERNGQLNAFEIKWNPLKKAKLPASFAKAYPEHTFEIINKNTFDEFVMNIIPS
jgi:uncharacterized protein